MRSRIPGLALGAVGRLPRHRSRPAFLRSASAASGVALAIAASIRVKALRRLDVQIAHILEAVQAGNPDAGRVRQAAQPLKQRLAALAGLLDHHHVKTGERYRVTLRIEGHHPRHAQGGIAAAPEGVAIAFALDKEHAGRTVRHAVEAVEARYTLFFLPVPHALFLPAIATR